MAGYNRIVLLGNLTRDPELKYLPSNLPVCECGLAVSRRFRDKEGNNREDVCFVDITAFGRQAEVIKQYMSKGKQILIEGRLKLDQWTAQDGTKRSKHGVVIENFQFVGPREGGAGGGGGGSYAQSRPPAPQAPAASGPPAYDAPSYDAPQYETPHYDAPPAADAGYQPEPPPPQGDKIPF
jgi:single-strand DNA-binding protein